VSFSPAAAFAWRRGGHLRIGNLPASGLVSIPMVPLPPLSIHGGRVPDHQQYHTATV